VGEADMRLRRDHRIVVLAARPEVELGELLAAGERGAAAPEPPDDRLLLGQVGPVQVSIIMRIRRATR
jgi:hypothetical protein